MPAQRFTALSIATAVACVVALVGATPAAADDLDPSAVALAAALTDEPGIVTGASFVTTPELGGTAIVATTPAAGFPKASSSYAVLSTGQASLIVGADTDEVGSNRGGAAVRGESDRDVTILKVDIAVPSTVNCMAGIDFRFLSDEYPEYVNSTYNDAFIFEIDNSTWSTSASQISAPGNLAFDEFGNIISINAAGASTMTAPLATGTPYDGSTRTLRVQSPLTPGAHSLYFSIFDQGDNILDSAVLIGNLVLSTVANPATDCNPGVSAIASTQVTAQAPIFDDANATITVPTQAGVNYTVDGAAQTGVIPGAGTVTVEAAVAGDDALEGATAWTHTFVGVDVTPATALAPAVVDGVEADSGTITIPEVVGVDYFINGGYVEPGDHEQFSQATVTTFAAPGYALQGAVTWQFDFTDAPSNPLVTPTEPTVDLVAGTFTIPEDAAVTYAVNFETTDPGTYPAPAQLSIEAWAVTSEETFPALIGATAWSWTFEQADASTVTASPATFTDPESGESTVTIPEVEGVEYKVNNVATPAGTIAVAGQVTVRAFAQPGFVLEGVTGWSHTYVFSVVREVVPADPVAVDLTGTANDSYTIPAVVGVRYYIDDALVPAGTYPAIDLPEVTIKAIAASGYHFPGGLNTYVWTFGFSSGAGQFQQLTGSSITGVAKVGNTLTASVGTWAPEPTTITYQWLRDGVLIPDATASTYAVVAADLNKALSFAFTLAADDMETLETESNPTGAVVAGTFTTTPTPTISGTPKVGSTLTAATGIWAPTANFTYQWYAAGLAISGASSSTFSPTANQVGKAITVKVTGARPGYTPVPKTSAATAAVATATFVTAPTPTISGTPKVGSTLTAAAGAWSPAATLTYQWYAAGSAISGATSSTLALTSAQLGKAMTVKVTATKTGYATTTKTSIATSAVAAGTFATAPTPTISGNPAIGQTLTATAGTWSPVATLKYQWYANGVAISGATAKTVTLTSSHAGKTISVKVTGSKTAYTSVVKTSAATGKIFTTVPTPTITGTAKVGVILKALPGTWSPSATFSYQWYSAGVAISGATKSTFKLTVAQAGKKITVRVTGAKSTYATAFKTSASTATVAP